MRDVLFLLIFFGAVPWILLRPAVGVYAWTVISVMQPHRQAWGFAYHFPFGQLAVIFTLVSLVFSREPKKMKGGAAAGLLFALVCYMTFTTLFALAPDQAEYMLDRVLKIQFMTFIALLVLYKREHVIAMVWAIVGSIGFYAVKGGMFTIVTAGTGRVWGPTESFIADNNALALATIITIPLWAFLYTQYKDRKWLQWCIVGAIVLSCFSVLGSQSRGGFLAICAALLFLWTKSHKKILLGIAGAIGAIALVSFMPRSWEERMATIGTYQSDDSAMGRIETWKMLLNLASDRPLIGGGFEPYTRSVFEIYNPAYGGTHSAHSIYFQVLGEHGFLAFGLFLLFWWLVWRMCSQVVREARGKPEFDWAYWLGQMTKVSIVAYLVGGAFLNLAYWDVPYFLFVCIAVTRWVMRHQVEVAAPEALAIQSASAQVLAPGSSISEGAGRSQA